MEDTFPKLLLRNATQYGEKKVALREKKFGIWKQITWQDYLREVRYLALGLVELGLRPGDRLALIGSNRREWFELALAAQAAGAVIVGLYQDATPREVQRILTSTGATIVVAEDQEEVDKLLVSKQNLPELQRIIYYITRGMEYYHDPLLLPYTQLRDMGQTTDRAAPGRFEEMVARGSAGDPALIAYTSGQTAQPKGAVLSYGNILAAVRSWMQIDTFRPTDEYVSFVSPAYIGELLVSLGLHLSAGFIVNFPESYETVQADIREIGPHIVVGPPRFWEVIVGAIHLKAEETSRLKRSIYQSQMPAAERAAAARLERGARPTAPSGLGNLLVFRPIRDSVGLLRTRLAFNMGGALSPNMIVTLHALGVNLRQIYGLTECAGIATMHRADRVRMTTTGTPLPDTEVRIADNGEIVLRSPSVFQGYYADPGATDEALTGGWLLTGDAGRLTEDGELVMIDRLRAVIQLSDGSRQSAQAIESQLKTSPYIAEAVVIGQNRPFVTALINIDESLIGSWAEAHHLAFNNYATLSQLPPVYDLIRGEVERVNSQLPEAVQIRRFVLLHRPFNADEGELTRTLKVRRGVIERHYASLIEALYGTESETTIPTEVRYADGRVVKSETPVRVVTLSPELAEVRR